MWGARKTCQEYVVGYYSAFPGSGGWNLLAAGDHHWRIQATDDHRAGFERDGKRKFPQARYTRIDNDGTLLFYQCFFLAKNPRRATD
jgi:hypothetical protein